MGAQIVRTSSSSVPDQVEVRLIREGVERFGHLTVICGSPAERDLMRRTLADAGVSLGVQVETFSAWVSGLWELLGDGRQICSGIQRQLLMADSVAAAGEEGLSPLRNNPGTVRMLARMARDLLPAATASDAPAADSEAEARVLELLSIYKGALDARGLIELSSACDLLAASVRAQAPASARCVVVRNVTSWPAYRLRLLAAVAQVGEASLILRRDQQVWTSELAGALQDLGATVTVADPDPVGPTATAPGSQTATQQQADPEQTSARAPSFLEVAGPHARSRAYADAIAQLADNLAADGPQTVAVVSARAAELLDDLAPYLAARGMRCRTTRFTRFADTAVGTQFAELRDLASRMQADEEGRVSATEWWPAPELTDWLYSPLSGADASWARAFDKKVRSNRALGVAGVLRELQSIQSRAAAARRKLSPDNPYAKVPVVCADVFQYLWQDRPVSALKAMCEVICAQPAFAFGAVGGRLNAATELSHAQRALEVLQTDARALGVGQAVAVTVLDGLCTAQAVSAAPAPTAPVPAQTPAAPAAAAPQDSNPSPEPAPAPVRPEVLFMGMGDAAALEPGSVGALFMADVDVASYPLSHEEGPLSTLAEHLGWRTLTLEPAARLRDEAERALEAASGRTVLARVTHDRQAKDRYPAAIWTELATRTGGEPQTVGEGDIAADIDPSCTLPRTERVGCLDPQHISDRALPYLVLKRADGEGNLVPRQFSASQIESYATCPLCWFISSRVRPNRIDAGFTNMEKGNFVHDVMDRFHEELRQRGEGRVTPENLKASLALLEEVFACVRAEHARGKTASSAPLVALSASEERQVDDILPQLFRVVRYEAGALSAFAPQYLEYSFNGLGVDYAGMPLGGRIDRVDTDAEGRAVVIDYKHRSDVNPFRLKDPTVPNKKTSEVAADDPRWLPEHTQTLIYAQALRRALGLDVRGALYFATKGKVAMRGAVSAELAEEEPGDGRVPGLKTGFPDEEAGGTMGFEELLDRVEAGIAQRFDELQSGVITQAPAEQGSCPYNHPFGFTRREA